MINRISTLSVHESTLRNMTSMQASLAKVQGQISSGKSINSYTDLSQTGKVEQVVDLQDRLKKIDDYVTGNTDISGRISATDNSVNQVLELTAQLRDALTLRRSSAGSATPIKEIVAAGLSGIQDNLNLRYEGRYVFAGSATDTQPVSNLNGASNFINGAPTDNYYQGNNVTVSARASDSLTLEYGIKASDPAFQKAIAAMNMALQGDKENSDDLLSKAVDMATAAISNLTSMRAKLNNDTTTLSNVNNSHNDLKLYLNDAISTATETDLPTATIHASLDQTILQATYQTFARINQLSLVNYLSN